MAVVKSQTLGSGRRRCKRLLLSACAGASALLIWQGAAPVSLITQLAPAQFAPGQLAPAQLALGQFAPAQLALAQEAVNGPTADIAGEWTSEWGPVILRSDGRTGNGVQRLSGNWYQAVGQTGIIKEGRYVGSQQGGTFTFKYDCPYKNPPEWGTADLTLDSTGTNLTGKWQQNTGAWGYWSMKRTGAATAVVTPPPSIDGSTLGTTGTTDGGLIPISSPVKDKWALVVGISKFADAKYNLQYPAKDATDFRNLLVSQGHFAPDHVHLLTDSQATRTNIISELGGRWLPHAAAPADLVVIYLSTHGSSSSIDDTGTLNYLLAYDTDTDNLFATGIAMQELTNMIRERVSSKRVVVILDACHSGAAVGEKGLKRTGNFDAGSMAEGTGQLVICSSSGNQSSWESKTSANSVFTEYLLKALQLKGADTTLKDAFDYLQDEVQRSVLRERGVLQTPVLRSKWQGNELRLLGVPTKPGPGL